MRLPKDILSGTYTKPRLFLCETDKSRICQLVTTNTQGVLKFNAYSELSFEVGRIYNDLISGGNKVNPFYDKIEAVRLIELEGFGYFELQGPQLISDGIKESKECTAYSLEYTLSQKYLDTFKINMGTVDSLEVLNASSENKIVPIVLYNPDNPKLSLLHLVLEEVYGWRIGHVDKQLQTLSRQFDIDRESVYDFLMNEVCKKFNCYIVFDTINNIINIYAESSTSKFIGDGKTNKFTISPPFAQIGTVSVDGYKTTRWKYNASTGVLVLEDVPEFGAHIEVVDGALTEWETDVFISFDNLSQEINISYDADAIKTRLTVTYGEDYDIREANLGLPYLTDLSYFYTIDWMGQDLYDAYTKYLQKSNTSQSEYTNNSQEILKINDQISYEENRLSLEYSLAASVNSQTVGTYYVRNQRYDGTYYYTEVSLPSEYTVETEYYSNVTTNVNETKVSNLYDALQKYYYNYFNKKTQDSSGNKNELYDIYVAGINDAISELNKLEGFDFIQQYTIHDLADDLQSQNEQGKEDSVVKFLNQLWPELGRTPLKLLYLEAYQEKRQTHIESGWSNKNDVNYGYYYPVNIFISTIEEAIAQRNQTINEYMQERAVFESANQDISNQLLMRNNFTDEQLVRLSAFIREDELHIDDIVETSLDDISSSFKIKQDAMEDGRIELQKICQPQLQFSMTMANIYALPEFEPIIHQFQLGKVIRVGLRPDYIKQSRLLQVNINFDDFSDFSCEFGELTSLRTQSDIHADLLSNAITAGKSVATNSSYWTRGSDQATALDLKIQQGLLDATTQIKAIDGNQGVVIDKYGIKLQKNIGNGEVDPRQAWLVNNMILFSDDGFKTSRSALGEITIDEEKRYGLIADAVLAGYIAGTKIVGGTLSSDNYQENTSGTHFDLTNGNFEIGGGKIVCEYDIITLKDITIEWESTNAPSASDIDDLDSYVDQKNELLIERVDETYALADSAKSVADNAKIIGDNLVSGLGFQETEITGQYVISPVIAGGALLIGDKENTYAEITTDGVLNCNGANITGTIIATAGEIGGCTIEDGKLQVTNANISGDLTAHNIEVKNSSGTSILFSASANDHKVELAGWIVDNNSIRTGDDLGSTNSMWLCRNGTLMSPNSYGNSGIAGTDATKNGWCITVADKFGVDKTGILYATGAQIIGDIIATSLTLSDGASIDGLSAVATSGDYSDLNNKPNLNVYIAKDGTVGLEPSEGVTGFTVSSQGLLQASNAIIYGTLYASAGNIGGCEIVDNQLTIHAARITEGEFDIARIPELTADKINADGIVASDVNITGTINSTEGSIGGFDIKDGCIQSEDYSKGDDSIVIWTPPESANYPDGLVFTLLSDGTYEVKAGTKTSLPADLVIPSFYNGVAVTSIANKAFYGCTNLVNVKIPNSITTIGYSAFANCSNLENVELPNFITSINRAVFYGCYKIHNIIIPDSVVTIKELAFEGTGLYNITIPDSVVIIGDLAFGNIAASYVVIGSSVKSIGAGAFGSNSLLKTVYYKGTKNEWDYIIINNNSVSDFNGNPTTNDNFINATRYYYSETNPNETGNFWYYNNTNGVSISCEDALIDSKYFKVLTDGQIIAENAIIKGNVTASSLESVDSFSIVSGTDYDNAKHYVTAAQTKEGGFSTTCQQIGVTDVYGGYMRADNTGLVIECEKGTGQLVGTWNASACLGTNSDQSLKHDVEVLDDRYSTLFDSLQPVRYKYNDGTSDRFHTGFIAQSVEESVLASGLSTQDFAAFIRTENNCALRYEEFIALCVEQIQKLKKRVEELEEKINIEEQTEAIENE